MSSMARTLAARLAARALSNTTATCSEAGSGLASLRRSLGRRRFSTTPTPPLPPPDAATSSSSRGPVSWLSLALTAATGAGLVMYYDHLKAKKVQGLASAGAATAGTAAIGGPFSGLVVGPSGKQPFSSDDLKGRGWHLLYFGFTHCPDVCPDELEKVAAVVDKLAAGDKKNAAHRPPLTLTPVFISLDPARDTPAQVGAYVKEFHPAMVGVTGPEDAVKAAARAYRVYHARAPTGPEPGDYLIDHSIITYLVGPDGGFVTFFGKNVGADAMAEAVWARAAEWEKETAGASA